MTESTTEKGSGSLEFDALLAQFHAIVWATAESDDPDMAYDEAGNKQAKKLQLMYRQVTAKAEKLEAALKEIADGCDNPTTYAGLVIGGVL